MDLEGFAKRGLRRRDSAIKSKLVDLIREVKEIPADRATLLAEAVLMEAEATLDPRGEVFSLDNVGVSMGDFGVGSRGSGRLLYPYQDRRGHRPHRSGGRLPPAGRLGVVQAGASTSL